MQAINQDMGMAYPQMDNMRMHILPPDLRRHHQEARMDWVGPECLRRLARRLGTTTPTMSHWHRCLVVQGIAAVPPQPLLVLRAPWPPRHPRPSSGSSWSWYANPTVYIWT